MDTRRHIRDEVLSRKPVDSREAVSLQAFVQQFDQLEQPFSEDGGPVHVTGSAIIVGPRGVVLHRHKRLGIWIQPGGHIDDGELPWDAALREAHEETGLPVSQPPGGPELVHVDVHPGPRGHTHLDLRYLLFAPDVEPSPPEGESPDVRWFGWDEAITLGDDGIRGALISIRARFDDGG